MRTWTLAQVKELLSTGAALGWLEACAHALGAVEEEESRLVQLDSQRLQSELRLEAARSELERAGPAADDAVREAQGLRHQDVWARHEAVAIALEMSETVRRLEGEVAERLRRIEAVEGQIVEAKAQAAAARARFEALRGTAAQFGAGVGQRCLFFPASDAARSAYVLPFMATTASGLRLDPLVIHVADESRPLIEAVALRDTPTEDELGAALPDFDTPDEAPEEKPKRKHKAKG